MAIDGETNRMKFEIAASIMPTEKDSEAFAAYMLGILMNYVDEETWSYCIGQAYKCWTEIRQTNSEGLTFTRERVVN